MSKLEKAGAVLAACAVLAGIGGIVMAATTPDDADANIGAGLVLLLAIALTFVGAGLLIASTRSAPVRIAALLAILLWAAYLAMPYTGARWLLLVLGIGALVSIGAGGALAVRGRAAR